MVELTTQLHQLFADAKRKSGPNPSASSSQEPQLKNVSRALHPFLHATASLGAMVSSAIQHSRARVEEVLELIDDCAQSDVTASLLLAEAELLSASVSVANLQQSVKSVADRPLTPKRLSERVMQAGKVSRTDLYHHLEELLVILESRVAQERLRATLCREEVDLFEGQMQLFASGWVAAADAPQATEDSTIQGRILSSRASASYRARGTSEAYSDHSLSTFVAGGEASSSSSATHIFRAAQKTERLLKDTVASATGSVLDIFRATASAARMGSSLPTALDHQGGSSQRSAAPSLPGGYVVPQRAGSYVAADFHLTSDEMEMFQERNEQLLARQQLHASNDAKQVETSVRELSQLTSLMSEMVLQQSEQIGILAKNTDEAQANVLNATKELKKPLASFWTASKQLILLLWISTAVVLVAHFLFR
jgi:syntaxin 1B/2/3